MLIKQRQVWVCGGRQIGQTEVTGHWAVSYTVSRQYSTQITNNGTITCVQTPKSLIMHIKNTLNIFKSTKFDQFCFNTYLKKSDSDLYVLWYWPHYNSSVWVFDTWLPAVGLQDRRTKTKNKAIKFGNQKFFNLYILSYWMPPTLDDFRRFLRVQTTTNLSGCLRGRKNKNRNEGKRPTILRFP